MFRRAAVLIALLAVAACGSASAAPPPPAGTERVVLAGGCFWGMEAVFGALRGVRSATPGYSGGAASTAHYEMVSSGMTGHAESVEVVYDPHVISFAQLLDVYFTVAHDPTEKDRQGPDVGTQYRSEIFTTSDAQRRAALAAVRAIPGAVTIVAPLRAFYPAEAYHRNYVARHPDEPYIVQEDLPKLARLHQKFGALLASN